MARTRTTPRSAPKAAPAEAAKKKEDEKVHKKTTTVKVSTVGDDPKKVHVAVEAYPSYSSITLPVEYRTLSYAYDFLQIGRVQ